MLLISQKHVLQNGALYSDGSGGLGRTVLVSRIQIAQTRHLERDNNVWEYLHCPSRGGQSNLSVIPVGPCIIDAGMPSFGFDGGWTDQGKR
jgi:hypothetical protein